VGEVGKRKAKPKKHACEVCVENLYEGTPAGEVIDWIHRYCKVPEGKELGKPLRLRRFQQEAVAAIYNNPAGTRQAILSYGRKNAKTSTAALLVLAHLVGPLFKYNSQIFSAAQSREQAALLFNLAAKMVRMSPELRDVIIVRDTAKELFCRELGTRYRALSAEASTAYGLSPCLIIHDELGQVRGPRSDLYEALETATGAQENPLSIIISTQAPTDSDLLSVLIDDALSGDDPRKVCKLYTTPMEDDPFVEESVRKANPAFGDFLNAEEVMGMAEDARRMPSRESEFRNLVLNQRVEAIQLFCSRTVWYSCSAQPKPIDGVEVFGGLDLSQTADLTALVLIGMVDGVWQVHPTFWLPGEGLSTRSKVDRVPYDVWARERYVTVAPGKTVDYEFVALWLREVFAKYKVAKIAFDRWNFKHLRPWLLKAGFSEKEVEDKFEEFGQGFQSMSPALRDLETDLLNQRVAHGNHPVMNMCAENAAVQMDPAGNRKLAKHKSVRRIDGMQAFAMARGVATTSVTSKKPSYQIYAFG